MAGHRGGFGLKDYTEEQLVKLIDSSLKATGEDIRHGRIPLDGRAQLPLRKNDKDSAARPDPSISDAAE
jgi:hypothetical protein